ncbi:MAG: class I SAM-dependent methyltransferase [Gemmatimonadota bacterium]|jgi:ubiquinone/menaquinone biosynthesis C-methylase UbiE
MSSYVLMRVLESAPARYDRGIRLLTLGRLDRVYDRLAERVRSGDRVLDIGCGTGALALRAAARGATVRGIDVNAQMLDIAARRARAAGLESRVELVEAGVAELDGESSAYDVVMSGLCFSELSDDELGYALAQVARILVPSGLLLVADEVRPRAPLPRVLHAVARAPLVALAWLLTQQTTHAVSRLPERVEAAGLAVTALRTNRSGTFAELVARRADPTGGEHLADGEHPADDGHPAGDHERHGEDSSETSHHT